MRSDRMRRVDEAVREVLSDAIATELKDPRVGFVTVTSVETAPDLRHARVYVSVLGEERRRELTLAGLRSAHGYLQRRVADELHIKHTPALEFRYDDTADRAQRLEALLGSAGGGDPARRFEGPREPPEARLPGEFQAEGPAA